MASILIPPGLSPEQIREFILQTTESANAMTAKTYTTKPKEVQAVQFRGENYREVFMLIYSQEFLSLATEEDFVSAEKWWRNIGLSVQVFGGGSVKVLPGNWIVKYPDTSLSVLSSKEFENQFSTSEECHADKPLDVFDISLIMAHACHLTDEEFGIPHEFSRTGQSANPAFIRHLVLSTQRYVDGRRRKR